MFRLSLALLFTAAIVVAQDDLDREMKSVIEAFSVVERNASDPVSSEQLFYQGAIPGLLRRLDPHSIFFDPGQFEQVKKMEASTQKGFGSVVSLLPGRVIVLQTTPGTPSAKAGLAPGDEILAINGYIISRLDLDQLTELLSQSRQQQAQLDVRRPGTNGMMRLLLTPEDMQAPSVDRAYFLAAGIGYVRVSSFDSNTGARNQESHRKAGRQPSGRPGAGSAQQSRRGGGGGSRNLLAVPRARHEDRHGARPRRAREVRSGAFDRHALSFQAGDSGQRQIRQRVGNRHRSDAGSRSRHGDRGAQLSARGWCRACFRLRRTPAWR